MALLLLRNEADCLVPNMETEPVSSHLPPELNRSPITARAVSSTGHKAPFAHIADRTFRRPLCSASGHLAPEGGGCVISVIDRRSPDRDHNIVGLVSSIVEIAAYRCED